MEPKQFNDLPLLFQVIAGFGLFFGTFMLAVGGWFWKVLKPKLPESLQLSDSTKTEVPIASAQIIDSSVFKALSHSIDRLIEVLKDNGEDDERGLDRNHKRLGDMCDELSRITEILQRIERGLKDRTII